MSVRACGHKPEDVGAHPGEGQAGVRLRHRTREAAVLEAVEALLGQGESGIGQGTPFAAALAIAYETGSARALAPQDVECLAAQALGGAVPARHRDLLDATGGHPLLVASLLMAIARERAARERPAARREAAGAALTPAEHRVALLVAQGHSNRVVAERLVLSPHTVNSHLAAVFRKLGVRSRVQLTRALLNGSR